MHYILFNPLSSRGKSKRYLKKIEKRLNKQATKYEVINVLENPFSSLKEQLTNEDTLIFFGGDGTIHILLNEVINSGLKLSVYVYKAGSGNDFFRDYKGKIVNLTDLIPTFPHIKYEGYEEVFINGVGSGIDAAVCNAHGIGAKGSYLSQAIKLFMGFKKFSIRVEIDNNEILEFDDAWFVTVQHGRFFGGGMKLSPKSKRDDGTFEVCIIHKVKLPLLLLIFPFIFLGWHMIFKSVGIKIIKAKHVKIETSFPMLQRDGEVYHGVKSFETFFKE